MKKIAITFGRLNPPTIGHGKLIDALKKAARGSEYRVYLSQTQNKKKDPLSYKDKIKYARLMFPSHSLYIMEDKDVRTAFDLWVKVYNEGYESITMVVGSDRVREFKSLIGKYNGKEGRHGLYDFKEINIVSAGERDPDAEGVEGMSASKMREAAKNNDFESFKKGLPKGFKKDEELFQLLQREMNIKSFMEWEELLGSNHHPL